MLISGEGATRPSRDTATIEIVCGSSGSKRGGPGEGGFSTRTFALATTYHSLRGLPSTQPLCRDRFPIILLQPYFESLSQYWQQLGSRYILRIISAGLDRECQHLPIASNCRRTSGTRITQSNAVYGHENLAARRSSHQSRQDDHGELLELRVPLLDHKVLEFAASLPPGMKLHGATTKYLLKKALSKRIPKEIRDRKKTGFPVPYGSWMRNELKDMVWDVLLDRRTINRGYFRRDGVEDLLQKNSNGMDYSKEIFSLLSLELWHRTFLESQYAAA